MNIEKMIDRLETILKRSEYLKHMMQLHKTEDSCRPKPHKSIKYMST